jgi:hypothetical protein
VISVNENSEAYPDVVPGLNIQLVYCRVRVGFRFRVRVRVRVWVWGRVRLFLSFVGPNFVGGVISKD